MGVYVGYNNYIGSIIIIQGVQQVYMGVYKEYNLNMKDEVNQIVRQLRSRLRIFQVQSGRQQARKQWGQVSQEQMSKEIQKMYQSLEGVQIADENQFMSAIDPKDLQCLIFYSYQDMSSFYRCRLLRLLTDTTPYRPIDPIEIKFASQMWSECNSEYLDSTQIAQISHCLIKYCDKINAVSHPQIQIMFQYYLLNYFLKNAKEIQENETNVLIIEWIFKTISQSIKMLVKQQLINKENIAYFEKLQWQSALSFIQLWQSIQYWGTNNRTNYLNNFLQFSTSLINYSSLARMKILQQILKIGFQAILLRDNIHFSLLYLFQAIIDQNDPNKYFYHFFQAHLPYFIYQKNTKITKFCSIIMQLKK